MPSQREQSLERVIGLLLDVNELNSKDVPLSRSTMEIITLARATLNTSREEAVRAPEQYVGDLVDVHGVRVKVTAAQVQYNPKNAYAGGQIILNYST